jgi:hypothetical protein
MTMARASGLRQVPWITVPEITHQHRENRPVYRPAGGGASRDGSDHRDGGAFGALEEAGHCMGIFCRDQAELFDRLAATTNGSGDPLMAIGLDAIGIGVEHQKADLAAGSGGACHGRERRGTPRPRPASDAVGTLGEIHAASMARTAAAVW